MCVFVCECVCVLGVVIEGKGRTGPSWQGESREPRAGDELPSEVVHRGTAVRAAPVILRHRALHPAHRVCSV